MKRDREMKHIRRGEHPDHPDKIKPLCYSEKKITHHLGDIRAAQKAESDLEEVL